MRYNVASGLHMGSDYSGEFSDSSEEGERDESRGSRSEMRNWWELIVIAPQRLRERSLFRHVRVRGIDRISMRTSSRGPCGEKC
jgi:hypothetical protein